jgi:hypothetical protein
LLGKNNNNISGQDERQTGSERERERAAAERKREQKDIFINGMRYRLQPGKVRERERKRVCLLFGTKSREREIRER